MGKNKLLKRLFLLLSLLCLFITPVSQAKINQAYTPFLNHQYQHPSRLKSQMQQAQPRSVVHRVLARYKFDLTFATLLFLAVILGGMVICDLQLKKCIVRRFTKTNNEAYTTITPFQYPAKKVTLLILLFLAGLLTFFVIILFTYESYENQRFVKWISTIFFIFALLGGYFFGNLKRSKQLEVLINKLQLQIIDKKAAQDTLTQSEQRLRRQNASLAHLALIQLDAGRSAQDVFMEMTKVSAETLDVERVGIWRLSDDKAQLECLSLYLKSKNLHTFANPLQAKDLPTYFGQLAQHRVTAINDVYDHVSTAEFPADYLQANGIGAMLDGIILLNSQVIGVICHEHVGGTRDWTLDEQSFAGSLADLVRLTVESHKRQQVEGDLLYQQKNLENIVQTRIATIENNAKLFRFMVERAPVTILYMNTENEIIEMNPEAERVSGYSREYAIGKTYHELFASEQNNYTLEDINRKVAAGEKIQGQEVTIRCADGSRVDLLVSRIMELDADGNPVIISIGHDISRQKAFERNPKKLLESEKRYSYVIKHAPIPILIINKIGNIIEVNPEAQLAAGSSRDEMIGKNFIQLIVAKESHKKAYAYAQHAMQGGAFRSVELLLQNARGEKFEYECSMSMLKQETEDEDQIVAIARDISHQKAIQLSLTRAREAAESADRIKSMFVASMSHELRTPLNSIIGFLGVVLQGMSGELNVKQKDQLNRAYHSAKHLLSLISDVIDVSKIEAGFLLVHVEKVYLKQLFIEIEYAVSHLVEEKRLLLDMVCEDTLQLTVDRKRLYQVVLNVVSNALKYTEQGSVHVTAKVKSDTLLISVKDTGIGIEAADLKDLFKPFERIESRLKVKTLGTGLGLYLTRKILTQLLGGSIEVKSTPGEGSTFTIKVPLSAPAITHSTEGSILEEPQRQVLKK